MSYEIIFGFHGCSVGANIIRPLSSIRFVFVDCSVFAKVRGFENITHVTTYSKVCKHRYSPL